LTSRANPSLEAVILEYAFGASRIHVERPKRGHVRLGERDDDDMVDGSETIEALDELIGLRVGLVYVDSAGTETEREVTIRALKNLPDGKGIGLRCMCHARQAPRLFFLNRVQSFYDVESGETFDDAASFLKAFGSGHAESDRPADAVAAAIAVMKADLHVLIFLARCDGWHDSELSIACNFVLDAPSTAVDINMAELERQVRMLDPDECVFRRALDEFARGPVEARRRLVRAIRRMVNADGVLSAEEGHFLEDISTVVEITL
jgi:hypothetical protein